MDNPKPFYTYGTIKCFCSEVKTNSHGGCFVVTPLGLCNVKTDFVPNGFANYKFSISSEKKGDSYVKHIWLFNVDK